jgi:Sulfotransferase domain
MDDRDLSDRERLTWRLYLWCAGRASRGLRRGARALGKVASRLSRLSGDLLFVPRAGDLYLVSYPRSGTTWLQMILHQLTTGGEMSFAHISEVIPFFERALGTAQNLNALKSPRILKTHLRYRDIPKGPFKYIYIARDGKDVLRSYYHFHKSHLRYRGTFDAFFQAFINGKVGYGSWFRHVAEWESHANDGNVLLLRYEDLARDLMAWIPKIAGFCGIEVSPSEYGRICERCSFAYMKRHERKFDFMTGILWERGYREGAFIREGP